MVRKLQKKLLAGILALLISTMSVGTLPVRATASVDVTLGSATFSGGQYYYENAVVSGDGIRTILLSFAKNVTAGDKITLPNTTGFTISSTSNDYTKRINVSGKTAGDVQAYLRGVGITLASASQTLSVTVTTENITIDTFYNIDTEHYYQYIVNSSIDWITAYNTAKSMTYMGRTGYLATITSLDEDTYVNALSGGKTGWLGGTILKNNGSMVDATGGTSGARLYYSQPYTNTNGVVSSGWYWACGPEIGTTFYNVNTLYPNADSANAVKKDDEQDPTIYFNWARGLYSYEPNNQTATAPSSSLDYYETCLTTLLVTGNTGKHGTAFSWNDKYYTGAGGGQWQTTGYFVEYGNLPRSDNGVGSAAFASDSGDLTRANTITATVTVQKDGSLWSGSGKSLALYQDGTKKYDLVLSGSAAACSALAGTYDVYDGTADIGVDISVSSGGGNATVDYYTLNLVAGAGTSLPTGSGVYLPGKNVPIDATVNTGYEWSKWTSGNTTLLSDQPTKSTNIRMPAGQITLTATAAPSTNEVYTIDYDTETIRYNSVYEIAADTDARTIIENGGSIASYISDDNAEAQSIYVRVKAADGAPAGEWTEITIPARPETPAATATAETIAGKNDGGISGVTTAMEWKADGGTSYTPVTADQVSNGGITGLSGGTYYVRYTASGSAFKSEEQEITIAAGHSIAVTFDSQGGSDVAGMTGKAYGDSVTAPAAPTRSGFYFAGWYKDAACTNAWTFTLDTLTDNTTLFAKWSTIPTYTVTGRIVDETAQAVEGATIRIMQGTTQFGTTGLTDTHGDFTIDNVPPGTYNLVITKGTKTAVIKVEVSDGNVAIGNATLPSGNANSILVVNGSDTPNVVVGGLDSEAAVQLADSVDPHADNVKITLTVEATDAFTAANGSEVAGAVTSAGKQIGMVLAIDVSKTVNGNEDASYNETNGLIEIIIPLPAELQGKASYAVYRYHNGVVDTITETPNDGEYIAVNADKTQLTLHVKKFSTYAIGYTNPSSGGGGGSVSASYTITASAGEGGSISPTAASVAKGGSKTFTITASEGYEIADVKVDGTSVGAINSYTFSNVGASHTIAAAFKQKETAALPYYVENRKDIFIGFASDASGTMKYIAPEGATVLFQENPKSFSDIAGHWAKDNIDFVTERELFLGTGGGKFSPESGMTRAMFATVIGRLYERSYGEILKKDDHVFTDVDYSAYYGAYIDWAAANNIITGIGGGLFQPDREITRQEMAAILYRFAEFLKVSPSDTEETQLKFPDAADIPSWATEAAMYCQQTGIITGRTGGNFVPQGTATRAEVAAILQRFIESAVK